MTGHQLDPSPLTTVDVFCRDLPPVLTIDPGDTIVLRSLNASGHLQPQTFPGEKVPTMPSKRRSGHCLTGPIAVRGAVPGKVFAVRFISLRPPGGYRIVVMRLGRDGDRGGKRACVRMAGRNLSAALRVRHNPQDHTATRVGSRRKHSGKLILAQLLGGLHDDH